MSRWSVTLLLVPAVLLVTAACDPPGKPKLPDAQAEDREQITDFKTLFNSNCSGCHGLDGKNGPARILNDALYLAFIPKETLRDVIANGRQGTAMPAWARSQGGPLTDKQIDILVNSMYANWGKPGAPKGPALPGYSADGKAGDASHGKQLFARACFMCHVKGGLVGPVTGASYLSLSSNQLLRTSIIVGRPDLGMPDYRILNMGKPLSDQDVTDLVSYIALQRPGTNGANETASNPAKGEAK
jgi:cytochrome c oxidase cbb3-type subunit III